MTKLDIHQRILVTGGSGLAGSALVAYLRALGCREIYAPSSHECDLTDYRATLDCFKAFKPDRVFHLAGFVRGIMGNMQNKATSFLHNILMNTHVVEATWQSKAKKIVAMGTVAAYPDPAPAYPITEEMIWQGAPHGSENSYGHAKRAMLAQLEAYRESYGLDYAFAISTNLYGPNDNFDTEHGHVIPSLVRKFYEAKQTSATVTVWGNGEAKRDFLYSADMAAALVALMEELSGAVNIGSGMTVTIRDAVELLGYHTGMSSHVMWDTAKPNGQHFRECDLSRLFNTGFRPHYDLTRGLRETYDWYAANEPRARKAS